MAAQVQTRKNEVRFTTSCLEEMYGKFLAKNVVRTWKEDFIDQSTGEVISIDRNEILFEKGVRIDDDVLSRINFCLQCQDITAVEVSNQRRLAQPIKRTGLWPYKVNAAINGKNYAFILQAQDVTKAIAVATDYIELNYTSGFAITGAKALQSCIILNDRYKPAPQELEGEQEDNNGEEQRDDTRYYKIEALVSIEDNASENENDNGEYSYDFLVKTKDVDTAKVVITAWINNKFKEQAEEGKYARLSIISASPFSCNSIIEKDFCLAYKEEEYTE